MRMYRGRYTRYSQATRYKLFSEEEKKDLEDIIKEDIAEIATDKEAIKVLGEVFGQNVAKHFVEALEEQKNQIDAIVEKATEVTEEVMSSNHYFVRRNMYAAGGLSGLLKDLGFNGAAKAISGGIANAFSFIFTGPYIGPMLEAFGKTVITPTMLAVPGSLVLYTLVKRGILDPIKFKSGSEEVKKIFEELENEQGCIKIEDKKELAEKIASIFVSGKNSPITKIIDWVKETLVKDKKAKNEKEAEEIIANALADMNTQSEK